MDWGHQSEAGWCWMVEGAEARDAVGSSPKGRWQLVKWGKTNGCQDRPDSKGKREAMKHAGERDDDDSDDKRQLLGLASML